jgi:hypothetical protein
MKLLANAFGPGQSSTAAQKAAAIQNAELKILARLNQAQNRAKAWQSINAGKQPTPQQPTTPPAQPKAAQQSTTQPQADQPIRLSNDKAKANEQYKLLPSGTAFIDPNGTVRRKP